MERRKPSPCPLPYEGRGEQIRKAKQRSILKARRTTDMFVVSDHGFSTIERSIDLRKILNDAGFVAKTEFESQPESGEIMLAGNGGSVLFYVVGHDEKLIHRLVEFLQQSDFTGVIFTKEPMEGIFPLEQPTMDRL